MTQYGEPFLFLFGQVGEGFHDPVGSIAVDLLHIGHKILALFIQHVHGHIARDLTLLQQDGAADELLAKLKEFE